MKPTIKDVQSLIAAGINPITGLPIRYGACGDKLKDDIKRTLRILDEQNATRRYKWYNLPNGLSGELIERILYYRGQGMFFYMPNNEKFYFLPYTLKGTIDVYGRFTDVAPLPFNGRAEDTKEKEWIPGMVRRVAYEMPEDYNEEDFNKSCVLLWDYTKQLSETNIPRSVLQDSILDAMAEAFPMARTALLANSGIKGMRVQDEDQAQQVKLASQSITQAALNGNPWIPMVGAVEFQDLTSAGSAIKSEEYLLYLQALDNFRLSLYGLKNGGLFQKKSHMLEAEQNMNDGNTGLIYDDGLIIRQGFCDLVNSIWPLGIYCTASETVLGADMNGDGVATDGTEDQSGTAEGNQEVNSNVE